MLAPSLRTDSNRLHGFQAPAPGTTSRPATLGMRTGTSHHLRRTGRQRPEARQRPGRRASEQRHRTRPPTTRSAKLGQSLHPGLRGWPKLRRRRCHHGTASRNLSARASCRCRGAGLLAAPEQQQQLEPSGSKQFQILCQHASAHPNFLCRCSSEPASCRKGSVRG